MRLFHPVFNEDGSVSLFRVTCLVVLALSMVACAVLKQDAGRDSAAVKNDPATVAQNLSSEALEELPPEVRLETVRALAVSELYEGMEFFRACGTINQGFEGCNFTFSDKVLRSFISTVDAADDGFYLRLKAKGEQLNDLCVEFAADSSGNGVRAFDRQGDERQDCLLEPGSLAFGDIHRITDDLNGNPAPSGKAPVLTEVARHEIKSGNSQI